MKPRAAVGLLVLVVLLANTHGVLASPAQPEEAPGGQALTPTFFPGIETFAWGPGDCADETGGVCQAVCECLYCGQGGGFCVMAAGAICDSAKCRVQDCRSDCLP